VASHTYIPVHSIPDYHDLNPEEKLAADGVALSDEQSEKFYRRQMQRLMNRDAKDQTMARTLFTEEHCRPACQI
jgi:hypothetical protein